MYYENDVDMACSDIKRFPWPSQLQYSVHTTAPKKIVYVVVLNYYVMYYTLVIRYYKEFNISIHL